MVLDVLKALPSHIDYLPTACFNYVYMLALTHWTCWGETSDFSSVKLQHLLYFKSCFENFLFNILLSVETEKFRFFFLFFIYF